MIHFICVRIILEKWHTAVGIVENRLIKSCLIKNIVTQLNLVVTCGFIRLSFYRKHWGLR